MPVAALEFRTMECVCSMTIGRRRTMQVMAAWGEAGACPAGGLLAGCLLRAFTDTHTTD